MAEAAHLFAARCTFLDLRAASFDLHGLGIIHSAAEPAIGQRTTILTFLRACCVYCHGSLPLTEKLNGRETSTTSSSRSMKVFSVQGWHL
jgi:hypothetical protein